MLQVPVSFPDTMPTVQTTGTNLAASQKGMGAGIGHCLGARSDRCSILLVRGQPTQLGLHMF